jgi:hypothetical protein
MVLKSREIEERKLSEGREKKWKKIEGGSSAHSKTENVP